MKASRQGIEITKAEMKALLAFAGDDSRFDHVHFRVPAAGANLVASVTDGHRACEAVAETEDANAIVGEWAVAKPFLSACYRALEGDQFILLRVKRGGLRTASILDVESLEEKGAITWAEEAASTQVTMDAIADILRVAQNERTESSGSWFAVQGRFLADLKLVTQACGENGAVTVYPPREPHLPIGFEAEGIGVRWTGVVMPVRVEGPGKSVADEDTDGDPDASDGVKGAVDDLVDALDKHGATMTVESGGRKVTVGSGRKNSSVSAE